MSQRDIRSLDLPMLRAFDALMQERSVSRAAARLFLSQPAVSAALARLRDTETGHYGVCTDCEADIPFDRLKVEPWALRCVACESAREGAAPRTA